MPVFNRLFKSRRQESQEQADAWAKARKRGYPPFFGIPKSILNDIEFAALWHLPSLVNIGRPNLVKWARAVSPPPDPSLVHAITTPEGKRIRMDDVWRRIICSYKLEDGTVQDIGITEQGALRAMLVTGMPGSGKTVFAETMVLGAINRDDTANIGKGRNRSQLPSNSSVVSDPNRDFSYDLLKRIPRWYERYVVFVDALNPERVASLNPLYIPASLPKRTIKEMKKAAGHTLEKKEDRELLKLILSEEASDDTTISAICSSILELFCDALGVSMDSTPNVYRFLANGVGLISEVDRTATFWTIKKLLDDNHYRRAMIERSRNTLAKPFWTNDFEEMIKKGNIASMQSRMEKLLRSIITAHLFCQRKRTVDFRDLIDDGYCVILCYSPTMGEEKPFIMRLSGKMLQMGFFSRAGDSDKDARRMGEIFYDEFQESVGTDAETVVRISEQIRKYGGAAVYLHQNFRQVLNHVLASLQSNTGSLIPMLVGDDERKYFAEAFANAGWPKGEIDEAFKELPGLSMIPRLFDYSTKHAPFVGSNPRREPILPDQVPLLVARRVEKSIEYPVGYMLETYDPENKELHKGILETYTIEDSGYKIPGFYRVTERGEESGYQMVSVSDGKSVGLDSLIEELTRFLYWEPGKKGKKRKEKILTTKNWKLIAWEEREAITFGVTPERIAEINNNPTELDRIHKFLLDIEMLPPKARQDYLEDQEKMSDENWHLYRAARYGRDLALFEILDKKPGLIPGNVSRLVTLSSLKYGVPVPEINAEHTRPDAFTAVAKNLFEKDQETQDAAVLESLSPKKKTTKDKKVA